MRVVRELTGAPAASLTPETPLMEAGVDSLAATELSSRLRSLTGVALSPTIVFEQPTPRAVAAHLLEQASPPAAASASLGAVPDAADAGVALALVGGTGRWAGGGESHLARWRLQLACADAMGSVPLTRWALEEVADTRALTLVQAACVRHGGFVGGAQRFDAAAFSLSLAEAGAMDPQQRLLLELGYAALHGSSQRRITLMGCDVGVLLGIERPDWALAQPPLARGSVYAVTGDNVSAAAGRVSFALGLQGPCSSVDTACSSALAAVHWGGYAIRGGESRAALALAVSLKLTPHGTLGAASAGMLSVDGRCKTLDARANGYARSEGVGALVLREGSGAALRLCGSAVRQDGRSASLTAPNGSAQRTLLVAALERATLGAFDVGSIEAHGTGTALGDPTEAGALAAVHGAAENPRSIVVGAAKASVGHTEASSGQVGLLRLSEMADVATGNAHLRSLNPLVGSRLGSRAGCFVLSSQAVSSQLACGVSSFGYSGTIAHAVLAFGSGGDREALAFGRAADASEALAFGSRGAEASGGGVFGARCSQKEDGCSTLDRRSMPRLRYRRRAFPWRDAANPSCTADASPVIFKQHTSPFSSAINLCEFPECASDAAVLAMAVSETRRERMDQEGMFVQLIVESAQVVLQLNDPQHFNSFSTGLGEDFRRAVQHICAQPSVASVVLQGAGPHFSVGGNPYAMRGSLVMSLTGFALSLRECFNGFLQLRTLPHPVVGAVHGTLVGGGVAGCLHVDYLVADHASTFEHGNLVRGVCPLGMLSQTFPAALALHAQHVYLRNARVDAPTVLTQAYWWIISRFS